MNDLMKSDLKMSSLNVRTTYHIVIHFFVTLTKLLSFKKYISYRPILDSSSAMTLIMYILRSIGADPGFQVRGAHLKKHAPSGGIRPWDINSKTGRNFSINLKEVIDRFIWTIELCHI